MTDLQREIETLSHIRHPNVIKLFTYKFKAKHSENPYVTAMLVFEYAHMGDLDGFMKKCKYLPENIAKSLIKLILNGLQYLHSKNMIHRDVKPHNILLDFQFQPKLSDFGLSRDRNTQQLQSTTDKNTFPGINACNYNSFTASNARWSSCSTWITHAAGTLSYMSPQARKGDISKEGDIFSVDVMLWKLMIGGYGDKNFDTSHAPFRFERKVYSGSNGLIIEYSADELYEKIQEKDYEKYFQLVREN